MAQQTINVGTSPNDGAGTPLRTAFQYTNSNFSELYTAVGPGGNNIVVPGSATITGDLTVDTNVLKVDTTNHRVGIGTASPGNALHVQSSGDIARFTNGTYSAYLAIDSAGYTLFTGAGQTGNGLYAKASTNAVQLWTNGAQRYDIDSTGISTWSVGGSTAMTLNSTGLGVGGSPTRKLSIVGSGATYANINSGDNTSLVGILLGGTSTPSAGQLIYDNTANSLALFTSGDSRLLIDTSGNVGIGVTPSAWSSGIKVFEFGTKGGLAGSGSDVNLIYNAYYDGSNKYRTSDYANNFQITGGGFKWLTAPSGTAGNAITYTQAMTLDASGNLLVGTTSSLPSFANGRIEALAAASSYGMVIDATDTSASGIGIRGNTSTVAESYFNASAGTTVGSIVINAGGVSFNNTSDYRIKKDVQPLTGGLARVNALKPSVYKFKHDDSTGEGFLAHELAEVVPLAVTGEKDAVNEDGSIKPQGVDLSKVVPILVAAIKELTARVEALEA